jgi:hypothetical protein
MRLRSEGMPFRSPPPLSNNPRKAKGLRRIALQALFCYLGDGNEKRSAPLEFNTMEPITTVTGVWTIAKTAGEISKKLHELAKSVKDRELKQQIDEITDQLRDLKQSGPFHGIKRLAGKLFYP